MHRRAWKSFSIAAACLIAALGCTLPLLPVARHTSVTMIAQTVSALQTSLAISQTAQAIPMPPSATPAPSPTFVPFETPVPARPVVVATTLCWTGPGQAYPVVSSVKEGTEVIVIGVGSTAGWLVIENPIYRDRCWIQADYLELDPYFSTAELQVFNPPPTHGPSPTPKATPTS